MNELGYITFIRNNNELRINSKINDIPIPQVKVNLIN